MGLNDINSLSHTKWNCKYHSRVCAKVSKAGILQGEKTGGREDTAATVRMEGREHHRSRSVPGPCAYAVRNTAKDSRIELYGISEGEEQHNAV